MESLSSPTASFWTLTLSEHGLDDLERTSPRSQIRRFFDALRTAQLRQGITVPIRYCGCLEHGGLYGRPHYHLLIYGLTTLYTDPAPYLPSLPRPQRHIAQWPHGHVDVAEYNPATIRYTLKYIFKASSDGPQTVFRTIRPAIGFYGLRSLAVQIAKQRSILPSPPISFEWKGRTYLADKWTRDTFNQEYIRAGGQFEHVYTPEEKHLHSLQVRQELLQIPQSYFDAQADKVRLYEQMEAQKEATRKAQTEFAIATATEKAKRRRDQAANT